MPSPGNIISPDHRGPAVNISIWICLILSGLSVLTKVITKLGRSNHKIRLKSLQLDDFLLVTALIFAVAQSIVVSQQVASGLGDHIDQMESSSISKYEKTGYAAQILYVSALCSAKAAGIQFALMLGPSLTHRRLLKAVFGLTMIWSLASIVGIVFQCNIPHPWAVISGKCFNQGAFWTFVEVTNFFTDIALITILCAIVWVLRKARIKYILMIVFATRGLLVIPITFKLVYVFRLDSSRHSATWDPPSKNVNIAITTAVVMNTSVIITCLPFMRPLIKYLQPGWSTSDVRWGVGYNLMSRKSAIGLTQYPLGTVGNPRSRENSQVLSGSATSRPTPRGVISE